ncbi:hypothetical protein LUW76_00105 [Actinomadura madurae]|uniref:hypothetical protein n=1 Tax=Actinomadura madurae TaxID=1993 RepID=UPI0020268673|nr:hypothetical protein [Actinomadura madurae]URM92873.1 hypothetical protein LUW76_00105 [Actinomadura madurae]URN03600.1 hypothetical protein LUW74_09860 [Actinomadura madurae]
MIDGAPAGTATRARPKDAPCAPPPGPGRDARAADAALRGLAEALLIAGVSPALPGIALLRSGRVRCGSALLAGQALALAAAALAAGHVPPAGPVWPAAATAGCVLLAALWAALIVHAYAVLVPDGLPPLLRLAGGTTVAVLCLLVIVPPLGAARALAPGAVRKIIPASLTGTDSISWITAVPEATPARMRSTPTQPLPGSARP